VNKSRPVQILLSVQVT